MLHGVSALGVCSRGVCSRGCLLWGCLLWGVPTPGRCLLRGKPPPVTATAAGGTHPTGMHSCVSNFFPTWLVFQHLLIICPFLALTIVTLRISQLTNVRLAEGSSSGLPVITGTTPTENIFAVVNFSNLSVSIIQCQYCTRLSTLFYLR